MLRKLKNKVTGRLTVFGYTLTKDFINNEPNRVNRPVVSFDLGRYPSRRKPLQHLKVHTVQYKNPYSLIAMKEDCVGIFSPLPLFLV